MVPPKASSASSLCSTAPFGSSAVGSPLRMLPQQAGHPFRATPFRAGRSRTAPGLLGPTPPDMRTPPRLLDADEQPHPLRRARCGMRSHQTPQASDEKPDPFRRATVVAHRRRMPQFRTEEPAASVLPDVLHSAHPRLYASRGPKREPDRAAGARHHPLSAVRRTLLTSVEHWR